ncbi:hypothetical protein PO654_25740 [Phytobacter diazotrophicus]|uniref:hypothetical protein n=1 Tax=Phytobacter diazotrophicus TaxID=395631 RepID=UPI000CD022E8|nr:hypothetical protein C2U55_30040 [Enterobacteriaceae bacterium ENNIH3]AUV05049.1 hypothetical protein C2U52_01515 [Enterobacteriaceae bacterium ENNIH2]QIH66872.1 hypothetical protein CRX67_28375 [Enterobacteriaceae bacterium A-F18]
MNRVTVYATGSCSTQTREGRSRVLIEQDGLKTVAQFTYQNTTAKRCVIQGLIDGVSQLQDACHVTLVTSTPLALEKARHGEGPNRDLIEALLGLLARKGCKHEFNFWEGRGQELNQLFSRFQR